MIRIVIIIGVIYHMYGYFVVYTLSPLKRMHYTLESYIALFQNRRAFIATECLFELSCLKQKKRNIDKGEHSGSKVQALQA